VEVRRMLVKIVEDQIEKITKEELISQIREIFGKRGGFELFSDVLRQYYIVTDGTWLIVPEEAKIELVSEKEEIYQKYYKYKISDTKFVISIVGVLEKTFRWGIPSRYVMVYRDCEFLEELRQLRDELYIP
jgi:hypothetical protein